MRRRPKKPRKRRDRRLEEEQQIAARKVALLANLGRSPTATEEGLAEGAAVLELDRDILLGRLTRDGADVSDRLVDRQRLLLSYYRLLGVVPQEQEGPSLAELLRKGNGDSESPALPAEAEARGEQGRDHPPELTQDTTTPEIGAPVRSEEASGSGMP